MLDNKINILLVVRWPVGGIRTYFRYVYNNFDRQQYSFTLFAPNFSETSILLDDLKKHDITYIEMEEYPTYLNFMKSIFLILSQQKYDIIHSHGLTSGLCSILPSLINRIPNILTIHDMFLKKQFNSIKGFLNLFLLSMMMPFFSKIHAVSVDSKNNILKNIRVLNIFKDKVISIPHGIEIERFTDPHVRDLRNELNLDNSYFLIGFLGRFMSPKGFKYLVEALNLLLQRTDLTKHPVVLTFGEGAFIREEKIYVKARGLSDNIFFLPPVPNVAPVLKGLDVVVMPSLWEACGLLAMETMVSGVPFIGTDCIGLREVLKDTPCKVVPSKNSEALAEAIAQEIINTSKHSAELFSITAAQRFDVKLHSNKLEKLINQILMRGA